MMVFVTELMVDHDEALGIMRKRKFPGHADAAVHLDAFFGHAGADAADAVLRRRQRAFTLDAAFAERSCGVDDRRAGLLDLEQQVRHAVLEGLETANDDAELLASAQILERVLFRD